MFKVADKAEIHHNDLIERYASHGAEVAKTFRKGNVGLILAMEHVSGAKVIVASTHLTWDPQFDYVKYA